MSGVLGSVVLEETVVGVALCGTLRIVTGHCASLFFLTGALLLAMTLVAWSTIEHERAE